MPPINPTDSQLAARMDPTPSSIQTPNTGSGLFRAVGDFGSMVYRSMPDGSTQSLNLLDPSHGLYAQGLTGAGSQSIQALSALNSKYGFDWNALPQVNIGDFLQSKNMIQLAQRGGGYGPGGTGYQIQQANDLPSFFGVKTPATLATTEVNNTGPNTVAPGVIQGVQPAQTGTVTNNINTYGLTPASPNWYKLQQNETIANYNSRVAVDPNLPAPSTTSSTGVTNTASPVSSIPQTIQAPTSGMTPPAQGQAQAPGTLSTWTAGLASTVAQGQQSLQASYQAQADSYQQQIDQLHQQISDNTTLSGSALNNEGTAVQDAASAKLEALQQEQQQFQDNYTARQNLTDQLTTLLSTGQSVIEGMKATTGLSSIMTPRISQTMASVTGQAGVITAALAAYDTQIGLAQSQLKSATDAITSIYADQITYWQNVSTFYDSQAKAGQTEAAALTADQKSFVDSQLTALKAQSDNVTKMQDNIQSAMLNPTTALAYAKAGVSLTDTPQQMVQKLAQYEQASQSLWSAPYRVGNNWVQKNTQTGELKAVGSAIKGPSASSQNNTNIGTGLSDAYSAINGGADPAKVRQAFLAKYPTSGAAWNAYFSDPSGSATAPITYPTPTPTPAKSSGGILNTIGNFFSGIF